MRQNNVQLTEHEILRRKLWVKIAAAVAGAVNALEPTAPISWANEALAAFDKTFSEDK